MRRIDLNVDIGEGFPHDRMLLNFATSANVCCGQHAGSWELTQKTIGMCLDAGVRIGMHPGYPDRQNMGRKPLDPQLAKLFASSIAGQVERFFLFVPSAHLKPHGALYNDAVSGSKDAARIISSACSRFKLPLMGLPNTELESIAKAALVPFIREGFADRAYQADGTLKPRGEPGAILTDQDEVRRQVLELAPKVDSICLHGDTPNCVSFAGLVYKTLVDAGYEVAA